MARKNPRSDRDSILLRVEPVSASLDILDLIIRIRESTMAGLSSGPLQYGVLGVLSVVDMYLWYI